MNRESYYSGLLDLYAYIGYSTTEQKTMTELLRDLENNSGILNTEGKRSQYEILRNAVKSDPDFGNMVLLTQSSTNGNYSSAAGGYVFRDPSGTCYVSYCGTGDGEWIDNAKGMTSANTPQQEEAARFFDEAARRYGWTENDTIIITGHSKGGNKAQYTTMMAENANLIDRCYSYDGQGFSEEAIAQFKARYGDDYQAVLDKMYGIYGDNDYVNRLGIPIIDPEHSLYIHSDSEPGDFVSYHALEYLFHKNENGEYDGTMNQITEAGDMSILAKEISEYLMSLPEEQRAAASMTIMQLMEMNEGMVTGLDGTTVTPEQLKTFLLDDAPGAVWTLMKSEAGRNLLIDMIKNSFANDPVMTAVALRAAAFLAPRLLLAGIEAFAIIKLLDVGEEILKKFDGLYDEVIAFCDFIGQKLEEFGEGLNNLFNGRDYHTDYSRFSVDTRALHEVKQELYNIQKEFQSIENRVREIKGQIDFGLLTKYAFSISVSDKAREINTAGKKLGIIADTTGVMADIYENNETKLISSFEGI